MRYLAISALFFAAAITPACGGGERVGQTGTDNEASESETDQGPETTGDFGSAGVERADEAGGAQESEPAAPEEAEPYAADPDASAAEPAPEEEAPPE